MMKTDNYFNIKRIYYLICRYLRLNHTILIVTASVAGFVILVNLMTLLHLQTSWSSWNLFHASIPLLFIGGYIMTSEGFNEIHSSTRGCFYLTLPASMLEKLTATWLITAIGYFIFSILVLLIINVILIGVGNIFTEVDFKLFNPFSTEVLDTFGKYMVTQSVFLFGAVYFQRANFIKTMLWLFLIFLFIAIYTLVLTRLLIGHPNIFLGGQSHLSLNNLDIFHAFPGLKVIIKIIFWYITLPFFLFISFIRLKERQV